MMGSGTWNREHGRKWRDTRLYRFLDRLWTHETIDGGGRCEYLHRWWIVRPEGKLLRKRIGIYLHHFVDSDWSRVFHDHPRRFVSIGLWGSYTEETPQGCRHYRAPWIRTFPANHVHRLRLVPGTTCWTLVIVLQVTREWGFWPDGVWMPWKEYVASERADDDAIC